MIESPEKEQYQSMNDSHSFLSNFVIFTLILRNSRDREVNEYVFTY